MVPVQMAKVIAERVIKEIPDTEALKNIKASEMSALRYLITEAAAETLAGYRFEELVLNNKEGK